MFESQLIYVKIFIYNSESEYNHRINMTTARQKVLAYFDKTRTASTREISRALKMSAATVRHHLRVLASDGRLEVVSVRGRDGRGRPEKIYSLPRAALGDNLAALSDALLTEAGSRVQVEALAERLGGRIQFCKPTAGKATESHRRKTQSNELSRPLGSWRGGTAHCLRSLSLCRDPRETS